jgi:DNA mismatch endonuclease (patch repair protein)
MRPILGKRAEAPVARYGPFRPRSSETSRVGANNRRQNTTPEILLRKALWAVGVRYRLQVRALPGCPDVVIPTARIAIFCDGDFWHGRGWADRRRKLAAGWNAEYWVKKIEGNRRRDRTINRTLRKLGWCVVRFWESEIRRDPNLAVARIRQLLRQRNGTASRIS